MSKKKNTLKDLDDFMKQQAATLVAPEKLSEKVEEKTTQVTATVVTPEEISAEKILHDLKALSAKEKHTFRNNLYTIIIQSLEAQDHSSPEDKMLINTALYLKNGSQWKDAIRNYWRSK